MKETRLKLRDSSVGDSDFSVRANTRFAPTVLSVMELLAQKTEDGKQKTDNSDAFSKLEADVKSGKSLSEAFANLNQTEQDRIEAKIGNGYLAELLSMSEETDERISFENFLHFGIELKTRRDFDQATVVLGALAQAPNMPQVFGEVPEFFRSRALEQYQALVGEGEVGRRVGVLIDRFQRDSFDFQHMVAPMMGAAIIGEMAGAAIVGKFLNAGAWYSRPWIAKVGTGLISYMAEAPTFALLNRVVTPNSGAPLLDDLARSALSIGALKFCGFAGKYVAKGLSQTSQFVSQQLATFLGMSISHKIEEVTHLRNAVAGETFVADTISSMITMGVGNHLGVMALGARYEKFQRDLHIHMETVGAGKMIPRSALIPTAFSLGAATLLYGEHANAMVSGVEAVSSGHSPLYWGAAAATGILAMTMGRRGTIESEGLLSQWGKSFIERILIGLKATPERVPLKEDSLDLPRGTWWEPVGFNGYNLAILPSEGYFNGYEEVPMYDGTGGFHHFELIKRGQDGRFERVSQTELAEVLARDSQNKGNVEISFPKNIAALSKETAINKHVTSYTFVDGYEQSLEIYGANETFQTKVFIQAPNAEAYAQRLQKMIESLKEVPLLAFKDFQGIEIYEGSPTNYHFPNDAEAHFDGYSRTMRLFKIDQITPSHLRVILWHEIAGHGVVRNKYDNAGDIQKLKTRVLMAIKAGGIEVEEFFKKKITDPEYYQRNWEERLSEAVTLYLADPENYKKVDPHMATVIQDIFRDSRDDVKDRGIGGAGMLGIGTGLFVLFNENVAHAAIKLGTTVTDHGHAGLLFLALGGLAAAYQVKCLPIQAIMRKIDRIQSVAGHRTSRLIFNQILAATPKNAILAKYQAIAALASRFRYEGFNYELATLHALGKTYHPIYLDSTIDIASSIARQVLEKKISTETGQMRLSLLRDTHPIVQPIIREVVQVITASHQPEETEKLIRIIRTREVIHGLLRLEAILTMVKNPKFGGEENRERVRRELDNLEELLGDNELSTSRITMVRAKLGFHSDFLLQGKT